ncbi:MAG: hypothetical protein OXL68_13315 [Paracoccaceae bacterium]|nr:hypothetical protein [Paracoccaceae bacterium]
MAKGEYRHTTSEFERAFAEFGLSCFRPNASNSSGITGWTLVAELSRNRCTPACNHGMQELRLSPVSVQGRRGWAYSTPFRSAPTPAEDGLAVAPKTLGIWVEFD